MGNLLSVVNALEWLGADTCVLAAPDDLDRVERIVLPGVGAFARGMRHLREAGFDRALAEQVDRGKPIFGICLGMQLMARLSDEGERIPGLGWFDGTVTRLEPEDRTLRVPQIGWNDTGYVADSPLFSGLPERPDFYYVHSYAVRCDRPDQVDATCDYAGPVTGAVRKENLFATQFHPEKSQDHGLKVLENFLNWEP